VNTVLNDALMEDYWYILREVWMDFNREYGYMPLEYILRTQEFKNKWLEKVRVN